MAEKEVEKLPAEEEVEEEDSNTSTQEAELKDIGQKGKANADSIHFNGGN
jgi:hypothetical protein